MTDARKLWTAGSKAPVEVSMDEIVRRAEKLQRRVRRSNAAEYVAGAIVVVVFVWYAAVWTELSPLARVGCALIACAVVFVVTYLALRGPAGEVRRDASTLACYRAELERRRDLLASVPRWYLAPTWPGLVLFLVGVGQQLWDVSPRARVVFALSCLFVVAVNVGIVLLNRRAAKKLSSELAELPPHEHR
jgi:hypothetical protein